MSGQVVFGLGGWFLLSIGCALFVCALARFLGDRPYADYEEAAPEQIPAPVPAPRIPAQRQPSAAVIVTGRDAEAFDDFLAELILTPHVGDVLS